MITRLALCALTVLPSALYAQSPGGSDAAKAKAALAPLTKLVGQWEGDARVTMVPGQPAQVVRQHEDITLESGGTVMKVHGVGRSTDAATKGNVVFEAHATVWYDNALNKLRMTAKTATGDSTEADIQVKPDTLIWGFPIQGGRIRFTIAFTNTDWHEVGHYIREGMPPIPTIDMRLKKLK